MVKKERTNNDIYELVGEFFGFTKNQFDQQNKKLEGNEKLFDILGRQVELINDDLRDIKRSQHNVEKELQGIKEDMTGIAGAIGELAEKDEDFEGRLEKLEKTK